MGLSLFVVAAVTAVLPFSANASSGSSQNYDLVRRDLAQIVKDHPGTTSLFELGLNDQGTAIVGIKIGHGPIKNLVVATHHGNEYGSTEVALASAADFAANPVPDRTIYVIPVLNISGFQKDSRNERGSNGSSYDANRDYPGPCGTEGPFHLKSTKALADFIAKENIVTSATLHTSGGMILYPWGISTTDLETAYDPQFKDLGRMCTAASTYEVGNSTALLYAADGAFEDYAFWKHGIWSMLFEIGETHSPNSSQVAQIIRENVPGLRKFMEQAPAERALDHDFKGRCDSSLASHDRHDE